MRLAFWRSSVDQTAEEKPVVRRAVAKPAIDAPPAAPIAGDLDARALGQALLRNKRWIIIPTLIAAGLSIAAVNLVTPR
jgi:polysaccharide biosynthesis transport protein